MLAPTARRSAARAEKATIHRGICKLTATAVESFDILKSCCLSTMMGDGEHFDLISSQSLYRGDIAVFINDTLHPTHPFRLMTAFFGAPQEHRVRDRTGEARLNRGWMVFQL